MTAGDLSMIVTVAAFRFSRIPPAYFIVSISEIATSSIAFIIIKPSMPIICIPFVIMKIT